METVRGDTTVVVDENRPIPLWQHIMVGTPAVRPVRHEGAQRGRARGSGGRPGSGPSRQTTAGPRAGRLVGVAGPGTPWWRPRVLQRLPAAAPTGSDLAPRRRGTAPGDHVHLQPRRVRRRAGPVPAVPPRSDDAGAGRRDPARSSTRTPPSCRRPIWRSSGTGNGARRSSGASPRTTRGCCRRSGRRSRSCSSRDWSGPCSPPRRWRSASTCRPARSSSNASSSTTARPTPNSPRGSTRSSPVGPDVAASTSRVTRSSCGSPGWNPMDVAGLASTRTFPLRSSFRPGYNMTINLVDRMGAAESRALLERSFAQFQADRSVVGLTRGIERNEAALTTLRERLGGEDGEYFEYAHLREELSSRERTLERTGRTERRDAAVASLVALRRGDVIAIPVGRHSGLAVVLEPDRDPTDPKPLILTEAKWAGRVSAGDFPEPARSLGSMRLPRRFDHHTARVRRDLASALRSTGIVAPGRRKRKKSACRRRRRRDRAVAARHPAAPVPQLARPRAAQPDRGDATTGWPARPRRCGRRWLPRRTRWRARSIASCRCSPSATTSRRASTPTPPKHGTRLSRIYCESDLLVAECLRQGVWKGLGPAELAAVVSVGGLRIAP